MSQAVMGGLSTESSRESLLETNRSSSPSPTDASHSASSFCTSSIELDYAPANKAAVDLSRRLPVELLTEIFQFTISGSLNSDIGFVIGGVNQYWRNVALGTRALWRKLLVTRDGQAQHDKFTTQIKRLGCAGAELMMVVGWNFSGSEIPELIHSVPNLKYIRIDFVNAVLPEVVNSFTSSNVWELVAATPGFKDILLDRLDLLMVPRDRDSVQRWDLDKWLSHWPPTRALRLEVHRSITDFHSNTSFADTSELIGLPGSITISCIPSSFPNLRRLAIAYRDREGLRIDPGRTVTFQHLEIIEIDIDDYNIWDKIYCPSIVRLVLTHSRPLSVRDVTHPLLKFIKNHLLLQELYLPDLLENLLMQIGLNGPHIRILGLPGHSFQSEHFFHVDSDSNSLMLFPNIQRLIVRGPMLTFTPSSVLELVRFRSSYGHFQDVEAIIGDEQRKDWLAIDDDAEFLEVEMGRSGKWFGVDMRGEVQTFRLQTSSAY